MLTVTTALWGMAPAAASVQPTSCEVSRAHFDADVHKQGQRDPRYHATAFSPWLRSDRFLLDALQRTLAAGHEPAPILQAMAGKDRQAVNRELSALAPGHPHHERTLDACREAEVAAWTSALAQDAGLRTEIAAASIPDAYRGWQRALGGYLFARPLLRQGAQNWRLEEHRLQRDTSTPDARLRWQPPPGPKWDRSGVAGQLAEAMAAHPLGWPWPDDAVRDQLAQHFAPIIESPSDASADRIGRLYGYQGHPRVDTQAPTAYVETNLVRLGDEVLLQISYAFWFPERTATGPLDPYAGPIDGLIWRVTVDPSGLPLLWDSIHTCGCYYTLVLPQDAPIVFHNPDPAAQEDPLVLIGPVATSRVRLMASAGDHFLRWPRAGPPDVVEQGVETQTYRLRPYAELLAPGPRRPPFRSNGLLSGTSRLERLFLFPAGIPDPGAMRANGHHATAFLGRRHFDDPELASGMISRAPSALARWKEGSGATLPE
ncbi:MAG: hypothetical protein EA417_05135 [Gammaproteobacteria bacterium]|nr:MAG: hypothetical protein EA417_05135 [Gammaproteobacteria bacterium]